MKRRIKRILECREMMIQCILLSMENVRKNIQTSKDKDFIIANAQCMTMLAEAYKTIKN